MKYNLRTNKTAQYIGVVLLILAFAFTSIGATSQTNIEEKSVTQIAISNYLAAQQNSDLSDEEKVKAAIDAYFTTRYESMKLLKAQDFSEVIEDDTLDWVKKEKDKREIEVYVATLFNTPYESYSYTIEYITIEIDKKKSTVVLTENNEVVTLPDLITSKMGNLQHIFTLHSKNGEWVIYKDEYEDEISGSLKHQSKEDLLKQVDDNYKKSEQQSSLSGNKVLACPVSMPLNLVNYSYSGTAARNYANTYWNTTNPPYYVGLGQDCTNFVSQAIYAGEGKTPPNTSGMTTSSTRSYTNDWYYVWNNSGSVPWINVPAQYTFITGNTSRIGPYGSGTTNFCNARVGDVVQIKDATGWFHEGIVVSASTPCVGLQSYYIDAHTTNRYYMQLNGWSMYEMRIIRINGWRGN